MGSHRSKGLTARDTAALRRACMIALCFAFSCTGQSARAQKAADPSPEPAISTQSSAPLPSQTTGVLSGKVTDSDGALVSGAQVSLLEDGPHKERTVVTDGAGEFHFEGVSPGSFHLKIQALGLAPSIVPGSLTPGQILDLPAIQLRVASANTEVDVSLATEAQLATEQVHAEEQQRVVGIIPNYFVTYDNSAVPLRAKQKFNLGWHVILDPTNFLFAAAAAGIEQENNTFPGYGTGPGAFGKRYGAALANSTSSTLLRGSIYPSLFHQDPRYFYKGTGTVWQRARYALATAVICKGDNGRWQPNYSGILGDLSAGALSNLYYPAGSRNGAALTFEDGLLSTAGVGVGHLAQEFLFKRLSTHVPKSRPNQP